jgi:hypothetical protein
VRISAGEYGDVGLQGTSLRWRSQDALDLLERKHLVDGTFPVEWTNVTKADRIETRGTYADWGILHRKKSNPIVTVDALYVLRQAGRVA